MTNPNDIIKNSLAAQQQVQVQVEIQRQHSDALDAVRQSQIANQQAEISRLKAELDTPPAYSGGSGGSGRYMEKRRRQAVEHELHLKVEENQQLRDAIAERDKLILEWMHSNESLKKLARQYGKELGVSDEQRQIDFTRTAVEVAEEDPRFSSTAFGEERKKMLNAK